MKGCLEKALGVFWLTARVSFQIALYSLVKHRENLMLHQKLLRALFHAPLQLVDILGSGCLVQPYTMYSFIYQRDSVVDI